MKMSVGRIEQAVISLSGKIGSTTKSIGWKEGYGFKDGFVEFASSGKVDEGFIWICNREEFEEVAKSMRPEQPESVTNEPDWKKAPEDAQFYSCRAFRKHEKGVEYKWRGRGRGKWLWCSFDTLEFHRNNFEDFEMRPESSELEWNGQGLPPVGAVCEVYEGSGVWVERRIVAIDGDVAIYCVRHGVYRSGTADVFRPIKSGREKWINQAQKHCTEYSSNQLGKIYDAMKSGKLQTP